MKLKWTAALTLAVSVLFTTMVFAANDNGFTDVDFSTEQGQAIEKMYSVGYLSGYNDGTFKPNATITRAELTRVFNKVFMYEINEENAKNQSAFTDVEEGAWYYNDIRIAQSNGYINGFNDGSFRPQDNFTRQQTCVVLSLAAGLQSVNADITISDEVSSWAEVYVKSAIADGAFELEDGNIFRGTANITRGEVCEALANYVIIESEVVTDEQGEVVTTEEGETETSTSVTAKITNNSGGGSAGGSSGGGSSSNNGSSATDTTSTPITEGTTEATTSASAGGDSATTTTTTEATTEATTEHIEVTLDAEEIAALENVIADTKYVLMYKVRTDAEKDVAQYMLSAMENYLRDNSFDVGAAIAEAKSMYDNLSAIERADFKSCVFATYNMMEVSTLQEVFAPFL